MWLSANWVEMAAKTNEILCIFSVRAKHLREKARLKGDHLQVVTEVWDPRSCRYI